MALVALVAVSLPSLRRPLVELVQQRSESRRLGVVAAVVQSGVVLLAAAAVAFCGVIAFVGLGATALGISNNVNNREDVEHDDAHDHQVEDHADLRSKNLVDKFLHIR